MNQDDMDTLDVQVAQEVMGWHIGNGYGTSDGWVDDQGVCQVTRMYFLPSRMWDLAAWLVVEKLAAQKIATRIETIVALGQYKVSVQLLDTHRRELLAVYADSAQQAVCDAALQWVRRQSRRDAASP